MTQLVYHVDFETGDCIIAELEAIEDGINALDISGVKAQCQCIRDHLDRAGYTAGQRCEFCRGVGSYLETNDDREAAMRHVCMMCLGSGLIRVRIEAAEAAS